MALVGYAAFWIVFAAAYLFFAGTIDGVEVTAAVICASLATSLVLAVTLTAKRHYELKPPARALVRPFVRLLPEAASVARTLLRAVLRGTDRQVGEFVVQPFDPGTADRASAGRRALSVIGVSLAPQTFVVRGERSDELLLHAMPETAPSADRVWPL